MQNLAALLQSVVYGDSAYPSGRYTLSHGLEGLVQQGITQGIEQVGHALLDHLRFVAAPGDGLATAVAVLLASCLSASDCETTSTSTANAALQRPEEALIMQRPPRCPEALELLITLDRELSATKITEPLRKASSRVGRQTLSVHGQVSSVDGLLKEYSEAVASRCTPGNQAIALGLIHQSHGLNAQEAVGVEFISLAVGWTSAALRLRQCDHVSAQAIVAQTVPFVEQLSGEVAEAACDLLVDGDFSEIGRASPGSDLASARHQFASARLFLS
ncbi:urease accessory protein UreF [Corynebacterium auriscanis]|uniref:urease accessory protein UreF n=1 Tax=Corynebacterium auriscanis TaxID=99807 RepID=UPI0022465BA4|nr:urease accessory UreF family protein [Corynebacterium auriscanis]MCX2162650.1 urease accessory protein UreF [Corynebacterium auriscanis]